MGGMVANDNRVADARSSSVYVVVIVEVLSFFRACLTAPSELVKSDSASNMFNVRDSTFFELP
jgi:hypothetical protein